jgi:hypothetical protein
MTSTAGQSLKAAKKLGERKRCLNEQKNNFHCL